MKPADRLKLTSALSKLVAKIAADLRVKMRTPGVAREAALRLHQDEKVGEDFDVWTDVLSRRAAVLWVLKSVYVRVLEDRGLVSPGRLLDLEAQHLFEKLAPHLGETAFLKWIYRDLASPNGGLPELFSPQPAELALPADELSRELIAFWRHKDADTGAYWSFAEERFEGELMGDLYQELDPVVKDRFALCQTPDFVRAFILDRTLTPAVEEFGADTVRMLDPSCGSGHFLIDGLKRLVAATTEKHTDWSKMDVVLHALARVVGVDLNDYACGLARARLIMTAAELAGVTTLEGASAFHPHVYWADGLEQVERDEVKPPLQFGLFEPAVERPRAELTRSDVRFALRKVYEIRFHAVVANPPYILERDEMRKAYHRELIGKDRRYVSATGKYSLGAPFTERCFQLAEKDGFVGIITSNNFTKRDFGKALIEKVLAGQDLTLVVDAAQAYIPFHSTPTVLLFGRCRTPVGDSVRAVLGKRGESGTPSDPAHGEVWRSIETRWASLGFDNDYISVADVSRSTLNAHPWSLGGGGAAELKQKIEMAAESTLGKQSESIGITCFTLEDDAFIAPEAVLVRHGIPVEQRRAMVEGDLIRDWTTAPTDVAVFPYDNALNVLESVAGTKLEAWLLPYKTRLSNNKMFGGRTKVEDGLRWYEYGRFTASKLRTQLSITFAFVATHNHFVLDRGGRVFKQSAPIIKLSRGVNEKMHLALVGVLNSSTACFWMKQVFYPKGSATSDISKAGLMPENNRYEFAATGLNAFPVPRGLAESSVSRIAATIDALATERTNQLPTSVLARRDALASSNALAAALRDAAQRELSAFLRMVFWQEELDWEVYRLTGLVPLESTALLDECEVHPDSRPFAWADGKPPDDISPRVANEYARRRRLIESDRFLGLIESPINKRLWRGTQGVFGRYDRTFLDKTKTALSAWLAQRVEDVARERNRYFSLEHLVAALQHDNSALAVCEVLADRRDFNLAQLVAQVLQAESVPQHPLHIYTLAGFAKRKAWERTWTEQTRADAGEKIVPEVPPNYANTDYLRPEYWQLRGKLDVPKERFIALTEVPGRTGVETLYGWAGWTPTQRVRAILTIDETLEDQDIALADRIGLLDSAWRLLPDVAREDPAVAARFKAELQALVGPNGPSPELVADWGQRFPPPKSRAAKAAKKPPAKRKTKTADPEEAEES
ncbi:MAG: BREX-2 system adenine-specific DNA-methyltransferase PglX [Myxococcaceae bacterium]|nr:BREX-2 system adenine-specific DNA-methyltransferase PglX [Myxococcaceae bacterium]